MAFLFSLMDLDDVSDMQGMERPKEPGLKSLRTIRELQEGMVSNENSSLNSRSLFLVEDGRFLGSLI